MQLNTPDQFMDQHLKTVIRTLLTAMGDDPDREGLAETPERVIKAFRHYTKGYKQDPAALLKVFEDGAVHYDQMVVQTNIPVWSLCEHHLAPFFGRVHIGYIPDRRVVGLSKLSRVVDVFARRFQVQERLTSQIANCLDEHLKPLGVGVVITCRHTCMEMRGVEKHGTQTTTSALRGKILNDPTVRAEFLGLAHNYGTPSAL